MKNSTAAILTAGAAGALLMAGAVARRRRRYDFSGKTVLITGGSRGLGLILARQLADEGAFLILCARNEDELERAHRQLNGHNAISLPLVCDVTDPADVKWAISRVLDCFGEIHVLINNAGIIQAGPMESMTREDYEDSLKTHFWGAYHMVEAVLPQMRARGEGRIVNIASIGGKIAFPHLLPYTTGKFALVGYSEGLRAELKQHGILVTTVCPGLMRTGSHVNARFKGQHEKEYAWFALSDTLPGSSMSAERAARQVINACRYGDAEAILSLPAHAATLLHGLAPGLTSDLLAATNRLLPEPDGADGRVSRPGWQVRSVPPAVTALGELSAAQNNE